jgi:hypothetical protein
MWVGGRDWIARAVRVWNVLTSPPLCSVAVVFASRKAKETESYVAVGFLCNRAQTNSAVRVQYNVHHVWTCGVRITTFSFPSFFFFRIETANILMKWKGTKSTFSFAPNVKPLFGCRWIEED